MFGKESDNWETPQAFYNALDDEFSFDVDVAATAENHKCGFWFTAADDALSFGWAKWAEGLGLVFPPTCWLNPPYSKCREFIAKAVAEARKGCTVVCLVPSRTDTKWWHAHVWDAEKHTPRPGVELRFVPGRLKFGNGKNSAPFPSVVIVFRPPQ